MMNKIQPFLQPIMWLIRPVYQALKPRLGRLNQHPPRELQLPAKYYKKTFLTSAPKISIVTPSFNQREFIERTLKSVLDQSYPNLEFYVQDGASPDGTADVLARYSDRLAGWSSCPDNGQSHAINVAFATTSGEIMAWLNSDDILLPGALAYVADYFSRHPDVDVVYGYRILIDEHDQEIGRWIVPPHNGQILSWEDFIPQETMFWRRRIWEKAGGGIDESFRFAMDWDLLVRFRDAGARFVRLPRFLGGFRVHPRQKSSAEISNIGFQEMDRIRQQLLGRVPSRAEIQKAVRVYLLRHVLIDLVWRIRTRLGMP
jgi:glycosyltransferase involved in cell wall biosynthesis